MISKKSLTKIEKYIYPLDEKILMIFYIVFYNYFIFDINKTLK